MSKPKGRRKKSSPKVTDLEASLEAMLILKETGQFSDEWLERRFGPNGEMWRPLPIIKVERKPDDLESCNDLVQVGKWEVRKVGKFWRLDRVLGFIDKSMNLFLASLAIAFCYLPFLVASWPDWTRWGVAPVAATLVMWLITEVYKLDAQG